MLKIRLISMERILWRILFLSETSIMDKPLNRLNTQNFNRFTFTSPFFAQHLWLRKWSLHIFLYELGDIYYYTQLLHTFFLYSEILETSTSTLRGKSFPFASLEIRHYSIRNELDFWDYHHSFFLACVVPRPGLVRHFWLHRPSLPDFGPRSWILL